MTYCARFGRSPLHPNWISSHPSTTGCCTAGMACLAWRSDNPYRAGHVQPPHCVFAGVCGVALLFVLARRTLPHRRRFGWLAGGVGRSVLAFWLAESQARMYTAGFAFAAAAAIVSLRFVDSQERRRLAPPAAPPSAPRRFCPLVHRCAAYPLQHGLCAGSGTPGGWFGRCCGRPLASAWSARRLRPAIRSSFCPWRPSQCARYLATKTQTSLSLLAPNTCVKIGRRISAVTLSILPCWQDSLLGGYGSCWSLAPPASAWLRIICAIGPVDC